LEPLGIDLADPGFWAQGVQVLDELVSEAELLAASLT
jgi:oligoendopeptidase F